MAADSTGPRPEAAQPEFGPPCPHCGFKTDGLNWECLNRCRGSRGRAAAAVEGQAPGPIPKHIGVAELEMYGGTPCEPRGYLWRNENGSTLWGDTPDHPGPQWTLVRPAAAPEPPLTEHPGAGEDGRS